MKSVIASSALVLAFTAPAPAQETRAAHGAYGVSQTAYGVNGSTDTRAGGARYGRFQR